MRAPRPAPPAALVVAATALLLGLTLVAAPGIAAAQGITSTETTGAVASPGMSAAQGSSGASPARATAATSAELVSVRAARHSGFDRFVFQFSGNTVPPARVSIGSTLTAPSGGGPTVRVPVPGRAVIQVSIYPLVVDPPASAGRFEAAFALPNITALRYGGWWEGEVSFGIGLAKRMPYHVHRLSNPARLVIDVSSRFAWRWRSVYFQDSSNYATGKSPYLRAVRRPVPRATPATGLLDRLFAGPTSAEERAGLRFVDSGATGFRSVSVKAQVARLRLTGGCSSGGSTFTVADQINATLVPLPTVRWVKIHDPAGRTENPTGRSNSIPECLEP